MRMVILSLAIAFAAPATGQSVGTAPLSPREILLEVDAEGVSTVPPDLATVSVPLVTTAKTAPEARRSNSAMAERLSAAARSAGVAAADVKVISPSNAAMGFVGNEALMRAMGKEQPQERTVSSLLEIRLHDPLQFPRLRDALEAAGATDVPEPAYSLSEANEVAARRSAKEKAIRAARDEAEAHARTLGMRVGRIVRISERSGASLYDWENMQEMFSAMMQRGRSSATEATVRVKLSVDFALVGAR